VDRQLADWQPVDRQLVSLKFTLLRHTTAGLRPLGWVIGALLVIGTWAAIFFATNEARDSVAALAFVGWTLGAVLGPILMSGSGTLRPEYFSLLPLDRRSLGRGLLISTFVSIASGFVLLAFLSASAYAVQLAPASLVVVALGAPLSWIFAITASRLVYALTGAAMRSKLGVEIAGIQFGLMFAAMFTGWMIVQVSMQSIPALLDRGLPGGPITAVLNAFPTSWPLLAIDAVAAGEPANAALLLAALAVVDVAMVTSAIRLLVPRASAVTTSRRNRPRSLGVVAGGGLLPATPMGAVIGKELHQWRRDPWRSLELRSGVWTGLAIGFFALVSGTYSAVSAFAGLIIAVMLGLGACNLYGQDGSAVWQNVVGESANSVRADVRGRQWATILIFLPQSVAVSVLFVVLSGHWWTVPLLLAAFPALFGAASGAALLVSATGVSPGVDPRRRVGPNDANGNIGIHVWVVFLLVSISVIPTAAAVVAVALLQSPWITAGAIAVGIVNGWLAGWLYGRIAIVYLQTRMPDVFSRIRYGRIFRDTEGSGILDLIERTTLKGEQRLAEQRQKQRGQRV
jgi:ABC-2 type transport system permease protein